MKPFEGRAVFYQRTGQRNQQFCDSSFEGFLLFEVECWGVCGALAAEAIWVSSTSKVGQLVPVPLLMCWRGALSGGLRTRLKGLRSLLGGGGWVWPTKVGVRTSGPCESCTSSTDLWELVQAQLPYRWPKNMETNRYSFYRSLQLHQPQYPKSKVSNNTSVDDLRLGSYQQHNTSLESSLTTAT